MDGFIHNVGAVLRSAFVATGVLIAPLALGAQQNGSQPGRVPVVVALVDRPVNDARALLVRQRAGANGINDLIVVVNDDLAPARIAAGAALLTAVMEEEGDNSVRPRRLRLADDAVGPRSEMGAASRVAKRAAQSPEIVVPGVGRARTTTIFLPDAALRRYLAEKGTVKTRTIPQ